MNKQIFQPLVTVEEKTQAPSTGCMSIDGYLKRAQEFAKRQDYTRAIFELRQAIKAYPNSALCHSTLSVLYLQTEHKTMASVHAKRSLALEPTNQLAEKIQQKLAKHKPEHIQRKKIQAAAKEGGLRNLLSKKIF